jgi:alkanesulfonate monooxygenase SsuD/methylene tetrahydromethanopterin reductase-like flavin-dependent oxidoreductase (luciferase family)
MSVDFGLGLRARHPSLIPSAAAEAQEAGFSHIWVYDSPRFAEAFVALSYAAMAAPRCVVGTAVSNLETRDVSVVANAFSTLSALTNERVAIGLGLGDSAVKFIGGRPARLQNFKEKLDILRALLDGKTIEFNGKSLQLPVPPAKRPPIIIAAERPKTFELAGAYCDGAIISPGGSPRFLAYAVESIHRAAREAGRNPDDVYICAWTHCVVGKTREDGIAELKPEVSRTLFKGAMRVPHEVLGYDRPIISEELQMRVKEDVKRQEREYGLADELMAAMGEDLFRELTVVGTADDVAGKVEQITAVPGVKHLIINIHAKDRRLTTDVFRNDIIPKLGRTRQ